MIEEKTSDEAVSWKVDLNHQPRRSRSRSASPSAHRQNNKDGAGVMTRRIPTRPLTPQPFRRPMISYTDDKVVDDGDDDDDDDSQFTSVPSPEKNNLTRKSRPIQRQVSAPGSQIRRDKSAGAVLSVKLKDPTRALYNRRSLEVDQKDLAADQSKKTSKSEMINGVARSHSQSRLKTTDKPPPLVTVIRHEPPKSNDLSLSTSKAISHQALLTNNSLESDAKYPSSSYDYTRYLDSRKGISVFEPTSALQVKFEDKDKYPSNTTTYHDSQVLSDGENARKKLTQLIKQDSINKILAERAYISNDLIEDDRNFVRSGSRIYDTQKSLELARHKPFTLDYIGDVNISQTGISGFSQRQDSFVPDTRSRDFEFKRDRWYNNSSKFSSRGADYPLLEESEDYFVDLELSPEHPSRSDFQSKLRDENYQGFCRLAEKHFGDADGLLEFKNSNFRSRFADDTEYRTSDYISPHLNGDMTRLNKYATISRTSDTSQAGRHERDIMPRSSTDHNIHYNNPSLAPPPSPTPPHSLREERTFSHAAVSTSLPSSTNEYLSSSRLSSREIASMHSYEFAGKRSIDQDIMMPSGIRTLPAYSKFNFRRPRGTWGLKPLKPATRELGNIPTPCLRESSV